MTSWPAVLVIGTTALIGGYMGFRYLAGERNPPTLIGVHLLLGAAGLEITALLLHGAPDGSAAPAAGLGPAAALTLAAALLSGLLVPLIAKPKPRAAGAALAAHAAVAVTAVGVFMTWVMRF